MSEQEKYLLIRLRPLEPYFLGSERNMLFGDRTQRTLAEPYFLRSRTMPSQSALFGILRYMGIRSPKADFSLDGSEENIGRESFRLLKNGQDFGRIRSIGPLFLTDREGKHYLPAPRNHHAVSFHGDFSEKEFTPYRRFTRVMAENGLIRWIPEDYSEKDRDEAAFLCLESGRLIPSPFSSWVTTRINRAEQKKADPKGGFLKKEYRMLREGFFFAFTAAIAPDFRYAKSRTILVGQGQNPFLATVEELEEAPGQAERAAWEKIVVPACFPSVVEAGGVGANGSEAGGSGTGAAADGAGTGAGAHDAGTAGAADGAGTGAAADGAGAGTGVGALGAGTGGTGAAAERTGVCYAYVSSDLFYDGEISELRSGCSFMLAGYSDYRVFTTDYEAKSSSGRYRKHPEALRLIPAGSVFIFADKTQQDRFRLLLEEKPFFLSGKTAGFNGIGYTR